MIDVTSELATKLRYLKGGAYYSSRSRGHKLGRWQTTDKPEVQTNECVLCKATAKVDARRKPLITGVLGKVTQALCKES